MNPVSRVNQGRTIQKCRRSGAPATILSPFLLVERGEKTICVVSEVLFLRVEWQKEAGSGLSSTFGWLLLVCTEHIRLPGDHEVERIGLRLRNLLFLSWLWFLLFHAATRQA